MVHEDRTPFAYDADLVAFLDGGLTAEGRAELKERLAREPSLAERLRVLEAGGRPFRQTFDALLGSAPTDRLSAMLEREFRRPTRRPVRRRLPNWAAMAAGLVLLVVGFGAGQRLRSFDVSELLEFGGWDNTSSWAEMLAGDLALYTPQFLATIAPDRTPSDSELSQIGAGLDVVLSNDRLSLPGLALKQARLLAYQDTPFIQLVYLDPQHGAVAFCIFASGDSAEGPESLTSAGMNVVYWRRDGKGYMLIGDTPPDDLRGLAGTLAEVFSPEPA